MVLRNVKFDVCKDKLGLDYVCGRLRINSILSLKQDCFQQAEYVMLTFASKKLFWPKLEGIMHQSLYQVLLEMSQ